MVESLVRVMKTHISDTKKEQKNGDQTGSQLLNNAMEVDTLVSISEPWQRNVSQQKEQIGETHTRMGNFGLISIGSCFICDPDWCPDYKKKLCAGKRLT